MDDQTEARFLRHWRTSDGPRPPGVAILCPLGGPPTWAPLEPGAEIADTEECAAAYAFAAAVASLKPEASYRNGPTAAAAPQGSDMAWFKDNPGRVLRVRPQAAADPVPHWAGSSPSGCFAVARRVSYGQPDVNLVALEAVGDLMPADTDEAGFAALKAGRQWWGRKTLPSIFGT